MTAAIRHKVKALVAATPVCIAPDNSWKYRRYSKYEYTSKDNHVLRLSDG